MRVGFVGSSNIRINLDDAIEFITSSIELSSVTTYLTSGKEGIELLLHHTFRRAGEPVVQFEPIHMVDNVIPFTARFFFARYSQLVSNADALIAFLYKDERDNESDVNWAMSISRRKGIPVYVFVVDTDKAA